MRQGCLEPPFVGDRLLDLLRGAEGAGQQRSLTHGFLVGAVDVSVRGVDRILRLGDLGVLQRFA